MIKLPTFFLGNNTLLISLFNSVFSFVTSFISPIIILLNCWIINCLLFAIFLLYLPFPVYAAPCVNKADNSTILFLIFLNFFFIFSNSTKVVRFIFLFSSISELAIFFTSVILFFNSILDLKYSPVIFVIVLFKVSII